MLNYEETLRSLTNRADEAGGWSRSLASQVVALLAILLLTQMMSPVLQAQGTVPTPAELDQLLSPVALYPDSLLAQIVTASTNPQEILDVDNWLQANHSLTGSALTGAAEQQGFDPAFIALVNFPDILELMAQHIDDCAAVGRAFEADQGSVAASIQRLRTQAYASGALRANDKQKIELQQSAGQTTYVIQPVDPQTVYVPQYDPTVVYAAPSAGHAAGVNFVSFGVGIGIGALLVDRPWGWGGWGWNWGSRRAYYNHTVWAGWGRPYHPPLAWYRPRPIFYGNRPGYGGNWHYRPSNYRPPSRPINRPGYNRPPYGTSNPPGYSRPDRPSAVRPPRPSPDSSRPSGRPSATGKYPRPKPLPRSSPPSRPITHKTAREPSAPEATRRR